MSHKLCCLDAYIQKLLCLQLPPLRLNKVLLDSLEILQYIYGIHSQSEVLRISIGMDAQTKIGCCPVLLCGITEHDLKQCRASHEQRLHKHI